MDRWSRFFVNSLKNILSIYTVMSRTGTLALMFSSSISVGPYSLKMLIRGECICNSFNIREMSIFASYFHAGEP